MRHAIAGLLVVMMLSTPIWAQDTRNLADDRATDASESGRQLPPTIADVVLLLKSYTPDTEKIARLPYALYGDPRR